MSDRQFATLNEIKSQPNAWKQAIEVSEEIEPDFLDLWKNNYSQILFTGCGSTYYLSLAAASTMQSMSGKNCKAFPASELLLSPNTILPTIEKKSLLFAISRSGSTTETIQATARFKEKNCGEIITLTNYGDSNLVSLGDLSLVIPAGQEESVAQTRSFASLYVAICALSCFSSNDAGMFSSLHPLPSMGKVLINKYENLAYELGNDHKINKYYFLGSGYRYGLASEASLKLKEMSLAISEPFYFLEFRHGPISMVDSKTLVIGLLGEKNQKMETDVINEIQNIGGNTLVIADKGADINFESDLPELVRGVLYMPVLQLMAYHRSISYGLDPDKPRNLTSVVRLNF